MLQVPFPYLPASYCLFFICCHGAVFQFFFFHFPSFLVDFLFFLPYSGSTGPARPSTKEGKTCLMTIAEAIELFESEMLNEVNNSILSESDKEIMIRSVKDVSQMVADTYLAEN